MMFICLMGFQTVDANDTKNNNSNMITFHDDLSKCPKKIPVGISPAGLNGHFVHSGGGKIVYVRLISRGHGGEKNHCVREKNCERNQSDDLFSIAKFELRVNKKQVRGWLDFLNKSNKVDDQEKADYLNRSLRGTSLDQIIERKKNSQCTYQIDKKVYRLKN